MYNRSDPRFRRTINRITQNLETANETAQVSLFSFSERYVRPCLGSIDGCLRETTAACFPTRDQRLRRHRNQSRWRPENSFDFYDDWEDDVEDVLLPMEDDEIDRLLGSGSQEGGPAGQQPSRQRGMSYGSRGPRSLGPRRSSGLAPYDSGPDPTIIPNQSVFGFLNKLPFKIGGKGLRYTPSAAGLKERTKGKGPDRYQHERRQQGRKAHGLAKDGRRRSGTSGSEESLSSRGDIFPSDEEDAVPLDDEFAEILSRKATRDDNSSGKTKNSRHNSSSQNTGSAKSRSRSDSLVHTDQDTHRVSSMAELRHEEAKIAEEEEQAVEKKREAAQRLAYERGLSVGEQSPNNPTEPKPPNPASPRSFASGEQQNAETYPFPQLSNEPLSPEDNSSPASAVESVPRDQATLQKQSPTNPNG